MKYRLGSRVVVVSFDTALVWLGPSGPSVAGSAKARARKTSSGGKMIITAVRPRQGKRAFLQEADGYRHRFPETHRLGACMYYERRRWSSENVVVEPQGAWLEQAPCDRGEHTNTLRDSLEWSPLGHVAPSTSNRDDLRKLLAWSQELEYCATLRGSVAAWLDEFCVPNALHRTLEEGHRTVDYR